MSIIDYMNTKRSILLTMGLVLLVGTALAYPTTASAAAPEQFMKEKVSWEVKPDACRYNIYYKEKGAKSWQYAVRNIPTTQMKGVTWRDYTLNYLKKGKEYDVAVKAYVCGMKQEKPVKMMTGALMPM